MKHFTRTAQLLLLAALCCCGAKPQCPPAERVKVLSLTYLPQSGAAIDEAETGLRQPAAAVEARAAALELELAGALAEASRYRGYKSTACPALEYEMVARKIFREKLPRGLRVPWAAERVRRPDYRDILVGQDICTQVDERGVREVWLWGYHFNEIEPAESNMAMGRRSRAFWNRDGYGDVSNSERTPDLPVCENTYVLYNYNYARTVAEALENHTHHAEAVLDFIEPSVWQKLFVGDCGPGLARYRCGNTHYPPNVMKFCSGHDYDWANRAETAPSDCADWRPDGSGKVETVGCAAWGCDDKRWKIWWLQNLPGRGNGLALGKKKVRNWWDFITDFDGALEKGRCLICP